MRKSILLAVSFLALVHGSGAQNSGVIIYERVINLHKNLTEDQQMMKSMIPETTSSKFKFTFSKIRGSYEEIPSEKQSGMVIASAGDGGKTWFDFENGVFRQYIEVDGEVFHTEKNIMAMDNLKSTGNSKKILGYTCQEYLTNDGQFTIWVTHELPTYITPLAPLFAKGAILAIVSDKMAYNAQALTEVPGNKHLQPDESTEITNEQFQDIREEKMDEMKQGR